MAKKKVVVSDKVPNRAERLARIDKSIDGLGVTIANHIEHEDAYRANTEHFMGATDERLKSLKEATDGQTETIDEIKKTVDKIKDRVNFIYAFAAGIGAVVSIATSLILKQFK